MTYAPEGLKGSTDTGPGSADTGPGAAGAAGIGWRGWLRWIWRQLTSMRVALMLLLLLAVAALPGSFFPQRPSDPWAVAQYFTENPASAPWLDRVSLFDVYGSPWFTAIYLLLFTSLIGCILPRVWSHAKSLRAGPARMPAHLGRFPIRAEFTTDLAPDAALAALKYGKLHKVETTGAAAGDAEIAAAEAATAEAGTRRRKSRRVAGETSLNLETGYGRETGNIVFHLALVGLLIAMAWGHMVQYRGQALVVEGRSFVNTPLDYDFFDSGPWFTPESLTSFRMTLDNFFSEFTFEGRPTDFRADVTITTPDAAPWQDNIHVNDPIRVGGSGVYLTGNGYAPYLTIRDADDEVAFAGPVNFLAQDAVYTSTGVVLVPDANMGENQFGFQGTFLPSSIISDDGSYVGSAHPEPLDPVLVIQLWEGDLGLDEGIPKSLLSLDTEKMTQVMVDEDGKELPFVAVLRPGEKVDLPEGRGSISFDDLPRFVALDVRYDPSIMTMGVFAVTAMFGLAGSLFLRRRRIWVRMMPQSDGSTLVTAAALARGDDPGLQRALDAVVADVPRREETQ